jgi:hypothetical protein
MKTIAKLILFCQLVYSYTFTLDINAKFNNRFSELHFIECNFDNGNITNEINNTLFYNNTQKYNIIPIDECETQINGKCHYLVSDYDVVLELLFYRSSMWQQEYYGMSNSQYFDVEIIIEEEAHPLFIIENTK